MEGSRCSDLVKHDVLSSNDCRLRAMTKWWFCLLFPTALWMSKHDKTQENCQAVGTAPGFFFFIFFCRVLRFRLISLSGLHPKVPIAEGRKRRRRRRRTRRRRRKRRRRRRRQHKKAGGGRGGRALRPPPAMRYLYMVVSGVFHMGNRFGSPGDCRPPVIKIWMLMSGGCGKGTFLASPAISMYYSPLPLKTVSNAASHRLSSQRTD